MKKLLAIILAFGMIFGCSTVVTLAQETSKIHPQLQKVLLTKSDYDTVDIYLNTIHYGPSVLDMPSWPDMGAARKELSEFYDNRYYNEIEPCVLGGIEHETLVLATGVIIVRVRVRDVEKIANNDMVRDLGYFENSKMDNGIDYYRDVLNSHYPEFAVSQECVYDEICEIRLDDDSTIDYVLIYATNGEPMEEPCRLDLGNRYIAQPHMYSPFAFGYAIYDFSKSEFVPLSQSMLEDYPFLYEYLDNFRIGVQFGDTDANGSLSIMDATYIQLALACHTDFPKDDDISSYGFTYRSDMNRDGKRDVLDATAIQLKLAKID